MRCAPALFRPLTPRLLRAAACLLLLTAACGREPDDPASNRPPTAPDQHSYAEIDQVTITDLGLDLALDFATRTISGVATYTLAWRDDSATRLVLDTRDLTINRVEARDAGGRWVSLQHDLGAPDPVLGSRLTIAVPGRNPVVRVTYATSPQASGLQWLEPSMTGGKRLPFMFSQSQQIHARSWVPLQDTPGVRFTYSAHVTTRPDLMVLMSADNDPTAPRDGDYTFRMPQPIPSYLMAIAAGDLAFQPISARSGVWAEPPMTAAAAKEFDDIETMIETAEALYGPYRWERYDMLVLPPSFPYGGMENPRLTFLTPTIIVGDKSLVSLVAHELAHSWSGNLVTFSTPRDAWLNEGITSYVESRLVEALYGADVAAMELVISRDALLRDYETVRPALQVLAQKPGDLQNPDDSATSTVYTKGAWFMQALEQRVGREPFDAFLRRYFEHFAFQSISSEDFAGYARTHLLDRYPGKVSEEEFDAWLHLPGIPATAPKVVSARLALVDAARQAWVSTSRLPTASDWSSQEWVHFLEGLPDALRPEQLAQLDTAFHLSGTPNGEIAQRWYPLAVRSQYTAANDALAGFLQRIGRRKLIMPTYTALAETRAGLTFARDIFSNARPSYHPITTASVQQTIDEARPAR
jgi:aminopeptidase N